MPDHPRQLAIPPGAFEVEGATGVFRAWAVDGGLDISFITAFDEPSVWGLLLVDIARHVARGYERDGVCTQDAALDQIKAMLDSEWYRPTDLGTTKTHQ